MPDSQPSSSRRRFFTAAATAGAAGAAVVALPTAVPQPVAADPTPPTPERGGGYHLSAHVKQYYKTTLI